MITKSYEQIRLIRDVDNNILFDGSNGDLYFLDEKTAKLLQFYMDRDYYFINDEEFIAAMNNIKIIDKDFDIGEIKSIFENRNNISGNLDLIYKKLNKVEKYSSLSINVSGKCNFDCIYCFGGGGSYGRKECVMDWKIAKILIDYWVKNINPKAKTYYVNFFGGEPFLNIELIDKVISYLNTIERVKRKTKYIVTTNGSIFNNKIRNLLSNNNFEISVSIDGLYFIHNKNRPYKGIGKSFDSVLSNYYKFSNCVEKLSAQITVNKKDIKYLFDSVNYLWSKGINRVYSNLVFDEDVIYDEKDFIDYKLQLDKLSKVTFDNLKNNRNKIYCNIYDLAKKIYSKEFSVNCFARRNHGLISSAEGDLYSCYRGIGKKEFLLKRIHNIKKNDVSLIGWDIEKCSKCFIQLYCGNGCPYENLIYNHDFYEPSKNFCTKSILDFEKSLMFLSKILNSGLGYLLEED